MLDDRRRLRACAMPSTAAGRGRSGAAAISVYVLAVFHRTSLGVAGLQAAERFGISSAQLSTFTILQVFVYAAMQLPVGALLDRYGSKRMLGVGLTLLTAAQFAFAFVDSYSLALLCRVLLGMGDAMVFISVLRLAALWFSPRRTPMVTQFTGLLGQLGALAAAGPLAAALHAFGWTPSYAVAASFGRHDRGRARAHRQGQPLGRPAPRRAAAAGARAHAEGGVAGARHPARALVALHVAVLGQHVHDAVGLPVPRLGPGPLVDDGERHAHRSWS